MGRSVSKYPFTIRSGRASKQPRGSGRRHRRASFVSSKAREGGDLAEPIVDRAQRRRGRKAPARPATQDRGGVYRSAPPSRRLQKKAKKTVDAVGVAG